METRNVEVSLAKAREWYKSDNKALKEVALQAYTKEELEGTDFKSITNFEDVCNALGLNFSEETKIINNIKNYSQHTAAIYMLDLVRKALNGGEIPGLVYGTVYYPWVRFYPYNSKPDALTLKKNNWVLGETFVHGGSVYILVGGSSSTSYGYGVGAFGGGYGSANTCGGLLCCKSREIAQHMSKHFSRLIFDAVYSQYDFVYWKD